MKSKIFFLLPVLLLSALLAACAPPFPLPSVETTASTTAAATTAPATTDEPPVTTAPPAVGLPTIDGVRDTIYDHGERIYPALPYNACSNSSKNRAEAEERIGEVSAEVDILYDGIGKLYLFAKVYDGDDYGQNREYCTKNSDPWQNDGFEVYFIMGGDRLQKEKYTLIMADACGYAVHYYRHSATPTDPGDSLSLATSKNSRGEGENYTYTVEMAIDTTTEDGRRLLQDESVYLSFEICNRTKNRDDEFFTISVGGRVNEAIWQKFKLSEILPEFDGVTYQ